MNSRTRREITLQENDLFDAIAMLFLAITPLEDDDGVRLRLLPEGSDEIGEEDGESEEEGALQLTLNALSVLLEPMANDRALYNRLKKYLHNTYNIDLEGAPYLEGEKGSEPHESRKVIPFPQTFKPIDDED